MKVWLNGNILSERAARIAPNDRGFLLADGLFETCLVIAGDIVQLDDHLERLRNGIAYLGITMIYNDVDLSDAMERLLIANDLEDASIRLTVTRGGGPRGLSPVVTENATVIITCAPYVPPLLEPARVMVSDIRRNENSPLCNIKTLNYLDNIMALRHAKDAGFDDAIMLNCKGNVACTTAANIFMRLGEKLVTPALSEGALPGVTRKAVIAKARAKGQFVEEGFLNLDDLRMVDEIFITNSLIGKRNILSF